MKKADLKNFPNLFRNIANWTEYTFYKGERGKRNLRFITRPHPILFEVSPSLYWVFKEIFVEDFYNIQGLLKKLPANPVVIDVGANAGFFDLLILSKLKNAKVVAYEPLASNYKLIQNVLERNKLHQNLTVFQQAVTGKPAESIELYIEDTESNSEIASVFAAFDKRNTKSILVPAVTLHSILQAHDRVNLLKMDCEGSEYGILYDTPVADLKKIEIMAIEVHQLDNGVNNLAALNAYLQSLSYQTAVTPITETTFYMEAWQQ